MKYCYLLAALLSMCSCATILNNRTVQIDITTSEPAKIVHTNDTLATIDNRLTINVLRQKAPVRFTVMGESITKVVDVQSKNAAAYLLNAYPLFWPGFIIDRKNPKRYSYPRSIYFDLSPNADKPLALGTRPNEGLLRFHISIPYINGFLLRPENETAKETYGFWGLSLGFDYYYQEKRFLNLTASAVTNFPIPVLGAVDFSGELEIANSLFLSLTHNHRLGRFSLGYGLAYGQNTWEWRYYDAFDPPPPTRSPVIKRHQSLGPMFSGYFQPRKSFFMGLLYRPSFLRFSAGKTWGYEHLLSFDMGWKIRLGTVKNSK